MKKRLETLTIMAISVLALTACGSAADTDGVGESTVSDEAEADGNLITSDTVFTEAAIENTVLYDADGITVTATGFDANAEFGPEIAIEATNASDIAVQIGATDVDVNGFMMEPGLLYLVVDPGETVQSELTLYNFLLDTDDIDTVAAVTLAITITDGTSDELLDTGERVTLTTSAAADYTQSDIADGDVLYNTDGVIVVNQGLQNTGVWSGDLVLYAENNTDQYLGISVEDVSINGEPRDDVSFWADLQPQTKATAGMDLMDPEGLNYMDIDDVREITFTLQIIDQDAWEEIATSDPITLTFE